MSLEEKIKNSNSIIDNLKEDLNKTTTQTTQWTTKFEMINKAFDEIKKIEIDLTENGENN
jgi:CII-binding regulator of phage lambda lysogenization HflD